MSVKKVFFNGFFLDLDNINSVYNWVVVENGLIAGFGTGVPPVVDSKTSKHDLKGQYLTIALEDSHVHFHGIGLLEKRANLSDATCKKDAMDIVKLWLDKSNDDVLWGRGWNNNSWLEQDVSHKDLPDTDRCIILYRIDGHALLVNKAVLDRCGIKKETLNPDGGEICRFASGEPTGVLVDAAMSLVLKCFEELSVETLRDAYRISQEKLLVSGISRVHDMGINSQMHKVLLEMYADEKLHVKTYAFFDSGKKIPQIKPYKSAKYQVGGLKLYADGALGSNGAFLSSKYKNKNTHGLLTIDRKTLRENVEYALGHDLQLSLHAIGDAAIRFVLDEFGSFEERVRSRRFRIEHASMFHEQDENSFKKLGIIPSIQPCHYISDVPWLEDYLCNAELQIAYKWDGLKEKNIPISIGTDSPIEPLDPIRNLKFAEIRRTNGLSRLDILRGYTSGSAFASFSDKIRGKLLEGYEADFTMFSDNPLVCDLKKLTITGIIIDGDEVRF
jgi:predicted amidohydrolase YtcJ